MKDTTHIYIGGSRHGQICQSFGHRIVRVALRPPPIVTFEERPMLTIEHETYEMRLFGLSGTRRRMEYFVLQGLSNETAKRLVDEYESSEEEPLQPAR